MSPAALILLASSLVSQQQNKPADEVRQIERRLADLNKEVVKLGYRAVPELAAAAADPKRPQILRLWMVVYLQSLEDPAAFTPLKRLLLDSEQPDLIRGAAARALAAAPVSLTAKRRALCSSLDASPGREALLEALFALQKLGCEQPGALERWAKTEDRLAMERAVAALGRGPTPDSLNALDRLFDKFHSGSVERRRVLEALADNGRQLALDRQRWGGRSEAMLSSEADHPDTAASALRLLASVAGPRAPALAARLLKSRDGGTVVAAAQALAALQAREYAAEVERVNETFLKDERFAAGPGRDPTAWYEQLGAALKALK